MPIAVFPTGPLETNTYVLYEKQDAVIIDPGGDLQAGLQHVLDFLSQHGLTPHAVILTHTHYDHVLGVAQIIESIPGMKVFGSNKNDDKLREIFAFGARGMSVPAFGYEDLVPGDHAFGAVACTVFATPGHSPCSVSVYVPKENAIIVGDLLFYRAVGRTDLPGSQHQQLVQSIRQHIYTLPPATVVYPGHGPETSVGEEKQFNPSVCG